MENEVKNKPLKVFQCGPVKAATWADSKVINNAVVKVYSIKIDRAYKHGDTWAYTNSFNAEDLPKVAVVANEAYKYLRMRTFEPQTHPNGHDDDSGSEKNDNRQVDQRR